MAQINLTFDSVFPNFTWWKKILTDYKIPDTYIGENDFNVLTGLAKGYLLKSTIIEQVYATASVLWGAYYQNYLTKKAFYTRTIDDLTNLEQKVTQALYQVAQDSSVKFGDVIDEAKLKGYLAALSTNTNTSDLQYLPQITQLKNYYNSLNVDSPALDMYQAFLKNLLLNLTENNFNNFPILYVTWENKNNKNTNLLASVDMNNKQIINLADGVNNDDAVNVSQLDKRSFWENDGANNVKIINPTKINMSNQQIANLADGVADSDAVNVKQLKAGGGSLWVENSGQLQPKTSQLISALGQKIASVADGVKVGDAVNVRQLNKVQVTANNADVLSKSNETKIASHGAELVDIEKRIAKQINIKVQNSPSPVLVQGIVSTAEGFDFIVDSNNNIDLRVTPHPFPHHLYIFKKDANRNYIVDIQNLLVKLDKTKNFEVKIIYKFDWGNNNNISGELEFHYGKDYQRFYNQNDFKVSSLSVQNYTAKSENIITIFGLTENNSGTSCTFYFKDDNNIYIYNKTFNTRFSVFALKYKEI